MRLRSPHLIGTSRAKRLAAAIAGVLAILISGAVMAPPAMATTITTLEHQCEGFGQADQFGNTAAICTDLQLWDYGNGTEQFVPRTEAFCLDANGVVVQCANITVVNQAVWATSTGSHFGNTASASCGHSFGSCPASPGRFYVTGSAIPPSGAVCSIANGWAVTDVSDGEGDITSIELPTSGKTVDLPSDFASLHAGFSDDC